jgi:hypothetical protein
MATRPGEVERLVAALGDDDLTRRDAAIARLRVIGARALARLAAVAGADPAAPRRSAALKAIEGIDDWRAVGIARTALGDASIDVRLSAIGVLRAWLTREPGTVVLEVLTGLVLDPGQEPAVRRALREALADLPADIVNPLLDGVPREPVVLPTFDHPASLREWLVAHDAAALSELHALVARSREQEAAEPVAQRRQEWLAARGAVHAALARRGSSVSLYDLRETLDVARAPLPVDFLTAVATIGDATCLEPLARAWAAAPAGEPWWRDRLAGAAAEIMRRTRLSGRSAVVKRVRAKWTGFV